MIAARNLLLGLMVTSLATAVAAAPKVDGRRVVIATHSGTKAEKAAATRLLAAVKPRARTVRKSKATASEIVLLSGCGAVSVKCLRSALRDLRADVVMVAADDGGRIRITVIDAKDSSETRIDLGAADSSRRLAAAATGAEPETQAETSETQAETSETPTEPGGTSSEPGGTSSEPGGTSSEPGGTSSEPGDTSTEPKEPSEPNVQRDTGRWSFELGRIRTNAWVTMAVGGGMTIVGLGLHIVASGKQDDVDSAPTDTLADLERLRDLEESGRTTRRWANVFTISGVGVGLAGVGLGLYQALSKTHSAVEVAPTSNGASVRFRF